MRRIFFLILLWGIFINGKVKSDTLKTIIKGNIENLTDGKIYLYKNTFDHVIDSADSKNGKFYLEHTFLENEPQYIGFFHYDRQNLKTLFFFPKKGLKSDKTKYVDRIMSDSLIIFDKPLKINKEVSNSHTIYANTTVNGGEQTLAYLESEIDLFDNIDMATANLIGEKIKIYPFSYHLLYELQDHKNDLDVKDLEKLMHLFNNDIKKSLVYNNIESFIALKNKSKKEKIITSLKSNNEKNQKIINEDYKKHLIVFWASWCGPCLQEIPYLKKINKENKDLELISISIDKDEKAWKKKLSEQKMTWKQLIANLQDQKLLEASFGFSNTVPYTIIIDNNFKVLYQFTGLISKENLDKILKEYN